MKFVTGGYGEPTTRIDNNTVTILNNDDRILFEIQLVNDEADPTIEISTNYGKLHIAPFSGNVIQLRLQNK